MPIGSLSHNSARPIGKDDLLDIGQLRVGKGYLMVTVGHQG